MKIRREKLMKQEIFIVDDRIDVEIINEFSDYVSSLSFVKNELDHEHDRYPIFSVDFEPKVLEDETEIGRVARELLTDIYPIYRPKLMRSYINLSSYGDMEYPHTDCSENDDDITVLYYVNKYWDYRWGGETIFYENHDSKIAILPRPGRYVMFPGRIEHLGGIPTRICNHSRLSLALKYSNVT